MQRKTGLAGAVGRIGFRLLFGGWFASHDQTGLSLRLCSVCCLFRCLRFSLAWQSYYLSIAILQQGQLLMIRDDGARCASDCRLTCTGTNSISPYPWGLANGESVCVGQLASVQ